LRTEEEVRMKQRANRREWARRVSEWQRSGKTSKEYAAETGVNAGTLLWWSAKLKGVRGERTAPRSKRGQSRRPSGRFDRFPFMEVSAGLVDDRFELELGTGRRLRIPRGFDAEALDRLLSVLK
jgi:hypothetical protein